MNTRTKTRLITLGLILLAASMLSCSGELADDGAPVELVVTNSQSISQIDLFDETGCTGTIGEIKLQVLPKNSSVGGSFTSVRVQRYRVSYQRTDGGNAVPRPFVRSIDTLIGVGQIGSLTQFTILESDALNQAPFVSLLPTNGGRDPVTGRPLVKMDVIVEIFGETLGGDNVYDATRFPLDFCYNCGGCA
jgi:hypothetical protein